jgi:hypothetical protein
MITISIRANTFNALQSPPRKKRIEHGGYSIEKYLRKVLRVIIPSLPFIK